MAEDKKKAKARIIQEYLPRYAPDTSAIHKGRSRWRSLEKARESYASGGNLCRNVAGMIDESFFGDGSKGFLFTEEGYYTKGSMAASATVIIHSMVVFWVDRLFLMRCWA